MTFCKFLLVNIFVGPRWANRSLLATYTTYTVCLMHCLGFGCPILALGSNSNEQKNIDIGKSTVEGVEDIFPFAQLSFNLCFFSSLAVDWCKSLETHAHVLYISYIFIYIYIYTYVTL